MEGIPSITWEQAVTALAAIGILAIYTLYKTWSNSHRLDTDYDVLTLQRAKEISAWQTEMSKDMDKLRHDMQNREQDCLNKIDDLSEQIKSQLDTINSLEKDLEMNQTGRSEMAREINELRHENQELRKRLKIIEDNQKAKKTLRLNDLQTKP